MKLRGNARQVMPQLMFWLVTMLLVHYITKVIFWKIFVLAQKVDFMHVNKALIFNLETLYLIGSGRGKTAHCRRQ